MHAKVKDDLLQPLDAACLLSNLQAGLKRLSPQALLGFR